MSTGLYVSDIISFYIVAGAIKLDNETIRNRYWDNIPITAGLDGENRWIITPGMTEYFGDAMDEPTFAYLKENLYPFGNYINAAFIVRENTPSSKHRAITSTLFHETEVNTNNSRDLFQIIENNKNLTLRIRDAHDNYEATMEVVTTPTRTSRVKFDKEEWLVNQLVPYRQAISRWAESRVQALSQKLNTAKTVYAKEGFESGLALSVQGWRFERRSGRPYLIYPGRINVQQICDMEGNIWALPDELRNAMYIEDLRLEVRDIIHDLAAKGFHPHCMGGRSNHGGCCLGDLQGRPFAEVNKLIDQYKMVNMGSNYGGLPTMLCEILLNRRAIFDTNNMNPEQAAMVAAFERWRGYCSPEGTRQKGFMDRIRKAAGTSTRQSDENNGPMDVWTL